VKCSISDVAAADVGLLLLLLVVFLQRPRLAYGKNVIDHVAEARSLGVNQVVIFPKVGVVCTAVAANGSP
jgi:hypothetical protein